MFLPSSVRLTRIFAVGVFRLTVVFAALLSCGSLWADPPPGYYDGFDQLTGGELKSALHQRISNHTVIAYANLLDPLRALYEDPGNSQNIILEYSLTSVSKQSASWNREHLWPRTRGDSDQAGPDDSDLFNVVPSDIGVNNERGNLYFDESNTSDPEYAIPAHPLAPQTSRDSDSWQPPPSQRGDIARALFYMEVRYDGSEPNTTDMELVSYAPSGSQMANLNTLLLWNDEDPPDDAERQRNDLIYSNYQHNRNPFIDHPEWVTAIWGTGTPSGSGSQPIAQVSTLSSSATESPVMSASLLISLNQFAGPDGVTVSFYMNGTATSSDYNITGQGVTFNSASGTGTVIIPPNYNSGVVSIVPVADGIAEPTESAVLNIASGNGYTAVPGASGTVWISDHPALPAYWNFDAGAPFVNPLPANSGSGSISFSGWNGTITSFNGHSGLALALVGSAGNNSWIDFNFSMQGFAGLSISFYTRGTSSGYDTGTWSYSVDGTNFTTLAGVNTATRNTTFISRQVDFSSISVLDDAPNVTLRYTLSGASGSSSNNRIDDFTINATQVSTGNQLRTVEVAASDAIASEVNSDPGTFAFRINGVANPGGLLIGFSLGGTATGPGNAGTDYNLSGAASYDPATHTGTILIPEGANTALLNVIPITDNMVEGAETAIVTVQSNPDAYFVGQNASAIININEPPPNDAFANAIVLSGNTPSATGSNSGATKEVGEPKHANFTGGKSVWWRWTAPFTGTVSITTTGSNFDTLLGVYLGNAVNALTTVAGNDDSGGHLTSKVTINVVTGTTYQIAVDGFGGSSGNITLTFSIPPPPPSNDAFANAIVLSGSAPTATGTNANATKEIGEPNHAGNIGGHSVWWRWTAPVDGYASVSTAGSNFDTTLAVYTGSAVNQLSLLASNNSANNTSQSQVVFQGVAGVTYQIAVDGSSGAEGNVALAINGNLPTPQASVFTLDSTASEQGNTHASFYVTLNAVQTNPVTVNVQLGGTAIPDVDYSIDVPLSISTALVTIPPGQTLKIVTITPITDNDATEFDETIIPALLNGTGYQVGSSATASTITLQDDTPYNAAWAQQYPSFVGPNTDPFADFNGNGVTNLLEFAFNGNPVSNVPGQTQIPLLPVFGFGNYPDPMDGNTVKLYPIITFNRRTDAPQLNYFVQSCSNLATDMWNSNSIQESVTTVGMPAGIERVTYRSAYPADGAGMVTPQFLRVKVIATSGN